MRFSRPTITSTTCTSPRETGLSAGPAAGLCSPPSGGWARRLRGGGYDLGVDVRGDLLTVLVMALAGIPRRLGWSMGGGAFLLTDVAQWVPGRHEVEARLALIERLEDSCGTASVESPVRVRVHASDRDRARVRKKLSKAWPIDSETRLDVLESDDQLEDQRGGGTNSTTTTKPRTMTLGRRVRGATSLDDSHAGFGGGGFDAEPPLLVAHIGAGTAAKRWPLRHWRTLLSWLLEDGWRVVIVGGAEDVGLASVLEPHPNLRDWTGALHGYRVRRGARAGGSVHRRRFRPRALGRERRHGLGGPLQRHQPTQPMAALVEQVSRPPQEGSLRALSFENLLSRRPSVHVGAFP